MKRLLPLVSSTFYGRLFWPVLVFLMNLLTQAFGLSKSLTSLTTSAISQIWRRNKLNYRMGNQVAVAIGMLLAGWLGATSAQAQSPGGVSSGLQNWLKADAITGVSDGAALQTWTSSSSSYGVAQTTASQRPKYYNSTATKLVNFNPSVVFDRTAASTMINSTTNILGYTPSSTTTSYHFISVAKDMETAFTRAESGQYNLRGILGNGVSGNNPAMDLQKDGASFNGWNPWSDGTGEYNGGNATMYNGGGTGNGTLNLPASYTNQLNNQQPQIFGLGYSFGTGNFINGTVDGWAQVTNLKEDGLASYIRANYFSLGQSGGSEWWTGTVNEVLAYNRELTAAELQRVNSYLAIKYGTTLGQGIGAVGKNTNSASYPTSLTTGSGYDYILSDGTTTVWNTATNAGYNFDIAGIGQDNGSGLVQKQSQSVNYGIQPILNIGTLATSNAANTGTFAADKAFEMWGSNGASTNYATAYLPSTYVSPVPSAFKLMSRIWKVQETGTVGTITISVPATTKAEVLLVSNSATFTPGSATEITLTPDGNGNLTAQVNLTNGQFFTFGATIIAPGGVTANMQLWTKADNGVVASGSAVSQWTDQSIQNHNLIQATAAAQPLLQNASTAFNFNPSLKFDGAGDRLAYKLTRFMSTTSSGTFFGAASNALNGGYENLGDLGIDNPHMGTYSDQQIMWLNGSSPVQIVQAFKLTANQPQIYGYYFNSGSTNGGTGGGRGLRLDGFDSYTATTASSAVGNGGPVDGQFQLGSYEGVENWNGNIAETVLYDRSLTTQEKDRVDTYLALKYGTTLAHNYLSADGTTIYNVSSYSANIAGIGRDNASGLSQKQSKSINADGLVTFGLGTAVVTDQSTIASTFAADKSFDVVGDNGLAANYVTSYSPGSFTSSAGVYSMSRIWRVQETGTVGTLTISIPGSATGTYLLVKSSASFTSGATEYAMTPDGNGNLKAQVDLTDGQFFTFARIAIAPGGVVSSLWFRSDLGVTPTTGSVTTWTDQAQLINATQIGNNATPTVVAGQSTTFNFNPGIQFTNLQRIGNQLATPLTSGTALDYYMVTKQGMTGSRVFNFNRLPAGTGGTSYDEPAFYASSLVARNSSSGGVVLSDYYSPALSTLNTSITSFSFSSSQYQMWTNGVGGSVLARANIGLPAQGFLFGRNADAPVFGDDDGFNGQIAEVIALDRNGSLTDRLRIQSYLGLKYGITLPHNYLAADGTTVIYNVSSYSANVTGIGRDDIEALQQKQSKSVNAKTIVTIGIGTGLAASNAANANTFPADKSYEIIGDNGLPTSYSAVYTPTSFTPAGGAGFYRMAAVWKVQETGTVGTVSIGVAGSSGADYLLVSNSASFPSGSTQELALTSDGNGNLVATVDLTNGQFFTFGSADKAPGGVLAGLKTWHKADALDGNNGDKVTAWPSSLLSSPYSVTQATVSRQPTIGTSTTALVNFNQSVMFDKSAAQQLQNLSANPIASSPLSTTPSYHFLAVGKDMYTQNAAAPYYMQGGLRSLMGNGSSGNNPNMDMQKDGSSPNGWNPYTSVTGEWYGGNATMYNGGGTGYTGGGNSTVSQQIYGAIGRLTNQQPQIFGLGYTFGAANKVNSSVDGYAEVTTLAHNNASYINDTEFYIGSSADTWWEGAINEVIAYNRELSSTELQRVNTYLAIKYGTTLGQGNSSTALVGSNINNYNYVATDGTVIWSTTANSGYNFDIAGIGQDNFEGLSQRQSQSVNYGFQPAIGLGTVATTNDLNPNSFAADKSYMVWGNNGQSDSYSVSYTPHSFTVSAPVYLMARTWKVQETQTVGTVMVSVPGSLTGTYLLVGASPTSFSAGTATEYALVPDGNGNLVASVDLANGQYFTFAKAQFAPGGVLSDLWFRADIGVSPATSTSATVSTWTDQAQSLVATQIGTNATPQVLAGQNTTFNFNPALKFTNLQRIGNLFATPLNSGTALDYYMVTKEGGSGTRVFAFNRTAGGTGGTSYDNPAFQPTSIVSRNTTLGGLAILDSYSPALSTLNTTISSFSFSTSQYQMWANGVGGTPLARTSIGLPAQGFLFGRNADAPVFGDDDGFNGQIAEVIALDRNGSLTDRLRIQSYLGLKYGITLPHNYLAADGTTVIYNVSSYSANVTGIGRDDIEQLQQKQSKSVNAAGKLTVGLSTIEVDNATNTSSFSANSSYVVFGDNGLTGTASLSTVVSSCPAPPSADKFTNLNYKVTETGSVSAVALSFDATSLPFNSIYPLWMQVASDAAFTNIIASVPMTFSASIGTTLYDFPANSTVYVRFLGNTTSLANVCAAPKTQTFHWNGWNYGTKTKTLYPNYQTQAQTLAGTSDMVMSVTVSDGSNNNLLYKPGVDWWPVFDGSGLFIPRNDNNSASGVLSENNVITTRMKFVDKVTSTSTIAAQSVDFIIRDIDGWYGGRDIVKVYGKQGANIITPSLSRYKPVPFDALQLNYQGNAQQAIGSNIPWDLGAWGNLYVNFNQPVEEIFVEYRKDNTYAFNVYNDLRIGAISATCKLPTPKEPLADNVYLYKEVSPNPEKTNQAFTYKFTLQNTNCANKTINLADVLPGGLTWVDSSFVYSTSLTVGSVNAYGNNTNLALSNVTVPPGTHYFYADAIGQGAGTFDNQASYTVTNGTGTAYVSDDPSTPLPRTVTSVTLTANDPLANLLVTKAVDKTTAPQNSTLTYTFTINNPNATAILTSLSDLLPGELTFVGGSLSGLSGAYTSSTAVTPYSGSAVLSMRDLSIPAGSSLTFSVLANTNSYTVGAVANNIALVTPDINAGYQVVTYKSGVVSTTIGAVPSLTINSPLTNSQTSQNPVISGTATAGSTVVILGPGSTTLCSTVATSGTYACPVSLAAGPQTLTAIASDANGVSTPATVSLTAVAPPTVAITSPVPNANLSSSNPPISGTATPGASVTVAGGPGSSGGPCITTANGSGNWTCSSLNFTSGPQTITATAGNVGGTSSPATVNFLVAAPLTVASTPAPQTVVSGVPTSASAAQAVTPGGGTLPLTYSAFNPTSGSATSGTGPLATPHGLVSIDPTTGVYSYTSTPGYSGTDAIGIKVCDSSTPTAQCASSIIPIYVAAPLTVNPSPTPISTPQNTPSTGNAATALNPQNGTQPLTYSTINPTTGAASMSTAHGLVSIDPTTGVYSYTPTPGYSGTDAIGIKVCDSSTPPQCATSVIPVTIASSPASGTLDCSTAQITGIVAGTPGNGVLKLTMTVSTTGSFPVTVSGSGLSVNPSPFSVNMTGTGLQTFYVPLSYSGAAFGPTTITVTGAGVCSPDMSLVTPKTVSTSVLNLGPACTPVSAATLIK